ncbi:MAG: glycosyltransferase family 9 protein [Melioribacteraceae bacterium]|nr:glycosyltransferase family 9 protein [Melioribacteraceae bacterium]
MSVELKNCRKILIIRLSSLGDILLTTPLLRTIKNQYPELNIDFLIRTEFKDTLKNNSNINHLIELEREYSNSQYRKLIIQNDYDLIIDLQNNLRSRRLTFNISPTIFRYKKPYLKRFLLVKMKINLFNKIVSIPEKYAEAIPGFQLDDSGLELFIDESTRRTLPEKGDYIGLCPGAKHKTKIWPKEYFIELGKMITEKGYKVALFGGKDDKEICSEIASEINGSVDLSNENKLLELALAMKACRLIICNDSGLMHASLGVGVPIVAIFGSTVKEFGFFPYKGRNSVLENNSLSCRPCSHIGRKECPKAHLNCLMEIKPTDVLEESLKIIS